MWTTPKTDWRNSDFFNWSDYNRIKNNLNELKTLADGIIPSFTFEDMGADIRSYEYIWDPQDFNRIENNLHSIFKATGYGISIGNKQTFGYNQKFIKYDELNRIERATLNLYNLLSAQNNGRRMLPFTLGGVEF